MTIGTGFPSVLRAAAAGADWALAEIYRDLAPSVIGYLRGNGVSDPEDVASEVFVGIVRGIGSFEGDERAFRSWVFSIAHNRLLDERRRLARRREHAAEPATLAAAMERAATSPPPDEREWLDGPAARAMRQLKPDQRAVVLLRVIGDLSISEVATIFGKSEGAVKALQHRALRRLEQELAAAGVSKSQSSSFTKLTWTREATRASN